MTAGAVAQQAVARAAARYHRALSAGLPLAGGRSLSEEHDLMLQRVPLRVESIRLKVEFVEPRFQWSDEVEFLNQGGDVSIGMDSRMVLGDEQDEEDDEWE